MKNMFYKIKYNKKNNKYRIINFKILNIKY